jgi:long-subunit acyl-CoA synthetase (AMP-forming)
VGEIVIRCESMLDGYYNRPDGARKLSAMVGIGQAI